MFDIVGKKWWYFLFSILVIIPGLISLYLYGLKPSIDFSGGTRISFAFPRDVTQRDVDAVRNVFVKENIQVATIQRTDDSVIVRTPPIDEKKDTAIQRRLAEEKIPAKQNEFETVGPTVGQEITWNAIKAVVLASLLIVLYIAYSFRKVPKPTSSWRFGICAIIALVHDVIILLGLFSLLGHFYDVEVDSLFVTAVLTVMGFSVHDTIVVFDRIRENLLRTSGIPFAKVVNDSILQTLGRSLNTSLTSILVLITLLIFGGATTQWFIVALLIGIISGTYSSVFNAAQLLVLWDEWDNKRRRKN